MKGDDQDGDPRPRRELKSAHLTANKLELRLRKAPVRAANRAVVLCSMALKQRTDDCFEIPQVGALQCERIRASQGGGNESRLWVSG
jgi:hypothetical protein